MSNRSPGDAPGPARWRARPRPRGSRGSPAWWPRGPASGRRRARRANARAAASKPVVGEHPVDHVPALERRGIVRDAGHHELPGAAGAGALGQSLGAAHRRRQPDHLLHEPERWPTRRARIRSQASASSNAQVRHSAWAANTVGHGSRSTRWAIADQPVEQSAAASATRRARRTATTSTPPLTTRPSARNSTARGAAALELADRRLEPGRSAASNRLSGGESKVTTASPSVALDADRRPSSSQLARRWPRSRPCHPVPGSTAGAAGRPRSAGSRGCGSGRRSASRRCRRS